MQKAVGGRCEAVRQVREQKAGIARVREPDVDLEKFFLRLPSVFSSFHPLLVNLFLRHNPGKYDLRHCQSLQFSNRWPTGLDSFQAPNFQASFLESQPVRPFVFLPLPSPQPLFVGLPTSFSILFTTFLRLLQKRKPENFPSHLDQAGQVAVAAVLCSLYSVPPGSTQALTHTLPTPAHSCPLLPTLDSTGFY